MAEEFQVGDKVEFVNNLDNIIALGLPGCTAEVVKVQEPNSIVRVLPNTTDERWKKTASYIRTYWESQISFSCLATEVRLIARRSQGASSGKVNNDGRANCYACGALTIPVDNGLPGSKMRICSKCKK